MKFLAPYLFAKSRMGGVRAFALAASLALGACGSESLEAGTPANLNSDLVHDMRIGLTERQFELYYQPQVDNGRIIGAEGLLRWRHPVQGFIAPVRFIPVAEDSGFIVPLGEWVLQAASEQLALWARQPEMASLVLAVNVSPRQLQEAQFVEQVLAALTRTGAPASQLKLEITESLGLTDVDASVDKMQQLQQHGVSFSLDDFGTGYASLTYIKRLPVNQLKIDASFVRDMLTKPKDAAIVQSIVSLGKNLGLQVIAEGVETQEQRLFLQNMGSHTWQGFLLSPPVPVAQFEALVRTPRSLGEDPR